MTRERGVSSGAGQRGPPAPWRCGDRPLPAWSVDIGVDRERWTRRVIRAMLVGSVLTIALGVVLGDQVLILGGLVVLALVLVFGRA